MQSIQSWLSRSTRGPIQCETAAIMPSTTTNVENLVPGADANKQLKKKNSEKPSRKTTVKKIMPTVAESGQIHGIESMHQKNLQDKPDSVWKSMYRACGPLGPNPITTPIAMVILGPLELLRWRSETKHAKLKAEQKALADANPEPLKPKTVTVWDGDAYVNGNKDAQSMAPADYDKNEFRIKSMRTENLNARHLSSNCAIELELFKTCVKDRFHTGNTSRHDCKDLHEEFRRCNNGVQ
jgi:hypothetical protein